MCRKAEMKWSCYVKLGKLVLLNLTVIIGIKSGLVEKKKKKSYPIYSFTLSVWDLKQQKEDIWQ